MVIETICKRTKHLKMDEMPVKALVILQGMRNNPHFPDAGPLLDVLEQWCEAMKAANVACLNGGRLATQRRRTCRWDLERTLDQLLGYVKMTSGSNVSIALSSGFELRKPPIQLPPLSKPTGLRWLGCLDSGRVELRWDPMHGVRTYHVFVNPDGPQNPDGWRMVRLTSRAKVVLHGMEPGKYLWFQVRGISARGMSPMSEPVRALVY